MNVNFQNINPISYNVRKFKEPKFSSKGEDVNSLSDSSSGSEIQSLPPGKSTIKNIFKNLKLTKKHGEDVKLYPKSSGSNSFDIFEAIQKKSKFPQDFEIIGSGRSSTLYGVTPKHVFRLSNDNVNRTFNIPSQQHIKNILDKYPGKYRSQHLAKIKAISDGKEFYFLKRTPGRSGSMDYSKIPFGEPIPEHLYPEFRDDYRRYIKDVSDMPLSAYEQLIWEIKKYDQGGKCIDPNSNNLMIDTVGSRMHLIDVGSKSVAAARATPMYPPGKENNLAYILSMLVDMSYLNLEAGLENIDKSQSGRHHHRQARRRRRIVNKLIQAACKENFLIFPSESDYLMRIGSPLFRFKEILKACNFDDTRCNLIEEQLKRFSSTSSPLIKQRIAQQVEQVFDTFSDSYPYYKEEAKKTELDDDNVSTDTVPLTGKTILGKLQEQFREISGKIKQKIRKESQSTTQAPNPSVPTNAFSTLKSKIDNFKSNLSEKYHKFKDKKGKGRDVNIGRDPSKPLPRLDSSSHLLSSQGSNSWDEDTLYGRSSDYSSRNNSRSYEYSPPQSTSYSSSSTAYSPPSSSYTPTYHFYSSPSSYSYRNYSSSHSPDITSSIIGGIETAVDLYSTVGRGAYAIGSGVIRGTAAGTHSAASQTIESLQIPRSDEYKTYTEMYNDTAAFVGNVAGAAYNGCTQQ